MSDEPLLSRKLEDELKIRINNTPEGLEARKRMVKKVKDRNVFAKTHIEDIEEYVITNVVETLSRNLSSGLIDLTIEKIKPPKLVLPDLGIKPTTLKPFVDFVAKYGSFEVDRVRLQFNAEISLDIKNITAIIEKGRISELSFESINIKLSLSLSGNGRFDIPIGKVEKQFRNARSTCRTDPQTEYSDLTVQDAG